MNSAKVFVDCTGGQELVGFSEMSLVGRRGSDIFEPSLSSR